MTKAIRVRCPLCGREVRAAHFGETALLAVHDTKPGMHCPMTLKEVPLT